MQYHVCRVKHDPDNNLYGDCVRACIASLLDVDDPLSVPHFYEDDCDPETGLQRIRDFLAVMGYAPFTCAYPGELTPAQVLEAVGLPNPNIPYLLFHGTEGGGNHVVVCRGDEVIHNPAWYKLAIAGALSSGFYGVMVLVKIL